MIVTGWNQGSPDLQTGAGYGIRIKHNDRNGNFVKEWKSINIKLDAGESIEVNLSKSFWKNCTELRSAEIGNWMLNLGLAPWPKNEPPEFELEHQENSVFKLTHKPDNIKIE
jgi:hypothetical protein